MCNGQALESEKLDSPMTKTSPVKGSLMNLTREIDVLTQDIKALEKKLGPISLQAPHEGANKTDEIQTSGCELEQAISSIRLTIAGLRKKVKLLTDNLRI